MLRPVITIPTDLLRQLRVTWDIDWRGQSAGDTNGGTTQVVYNAFPRWVGTPEALLIGAEILQWRAIRAQAQGLLGIYQVPMLDPLGHGEIGPAVPFSTGETFDTGQGFANEPLMQAASAAAVGATALTLSGDTAPRIGQIMGHGYWPFMVVGVDDVSPGVWSVSIQMPLRAAVGVGDTIRWQGVGLFEMVDASAGNPAYGVTRTTQIAIGLREVLTR